MMKDEFYYYPLDEGYSERVHTNDGVRALNEDSHMMRMLREMDRDGNDVSAPLAEWVAAINFIKNVQGTAEELQTHNSYAAELLKKLTD